MVRTKVVARDVAAISKELMNHIDSDTAFPPSIPTRTVRLSTAVLDEPGIGFQKYFYAVGVTDLVQKTLSHLKHIINDGDTVFTAKVSIRRGKKWYNYAKISVPENARDFVIVRTWKY